MASFYNGNSNFSFRSSSESEDNGDTTDNENQISSYGSTAFRNLMDTSSHSTPQVIEDTEENVRSQTQDVFLNYMYQSYTIDTNRGELDEAPTPKELLNLSRNPLTPAAEVGRRLACLGDNFSEHYSNQLDCMVDSLNNDDAYNAFAEIARRVFDGGIRWSRILVLLNFGYRMAVAKLRHMSADFSNFLSRIVTFMIKFIVTEKIARWIAQNGGWVAAINIIPGTSSTAFYTISAIALFSVLAVIFRHNYL